MKFRTDFLVLIGLCAFVIAHPVLDTLGHGATFFVTHGADSVDLFLFAAVLYLVPAVLLILLAAVLGLLSPTLGHLFVALAVGVLVGLWLLTIISGVAAMPALVGAGLLGVVVASAYYMSSRLRELLLFAGLLSPIVLVSFLFFTPVRSLLLPPEPGAYQDGGRDTSIVVLVLDELSQAAITTPAGDIDAGRLPNFARLAGMSTWYRDATTVSIQTERATPAILTGMRPDEETQPVYSDWPRNLFSLTAASHKVTAMEIYTRLCPQRICPPGGEVAATVFEPVTMYLDAGVVWLHAVLPGSLAGQYLPSISNRWSNFTRDSDNSGEESGSPLVALYADMRQNQVGRFAHFIETVKDATAPSVIYLHLALPHIPWIFLPDGTTYNGEFAPGQALPAYKWIDSQYLVDQGALRYALQIEYVDRLLGEALDALEESGNLDDTMFIVVSDHGVAFTAGEERRIPRPDTLADVARIPLFIKYPRQRSGERDNRKVETIDILPTIAEVLGLPLSAVTDGQSLIGDSWQPVERRVLEVADQLPQFESHMDMATASERFYRVIHEGRTAMDGIGLGSGRRFVAGALPSLGKPRPEQMLQLDKAWWYTDIDLNSGFLPARLTGTLRDAALGSELLVTLNDRVAGSGMTYDEAGRLSIMLDPRLFRAGMNTLRAFSLEDDVIREITITADHEGWSVQRGDRGELTVLDQQGVFYRSDPTLGGRVAFSSSFLGAMTLNGYACDPANDLAPSTILLVDGTEVISSSFTMKGKPFLSKDPGDSALQCWFSLDMNQSQRLAGGGFSVLALFDDGRVREISLGR